MNKQRQLLTSLEDDVCRLQEEVKDLELQFHSVAMGIPTEQTVWSVAAEYFRLFRYGFRSPPDVLNAFALKFLRLSMAPDVTDGFEALGDRSDGRGGASGGEWHPLAAKLLNNRLVVQGSVSLDWDDTTNRIVRVVTQLDMVTPMLRLLGNLEDVSRVFDKALISLEGRLSVTELQFA
ncbi:hypothetical protein PInf_021124 [Phytophthora infestans]|nr:hypothetical protein PInf_021124 [Phytophthora infestans]